VTTAGERVTRRVDVINERGLHARASAKLVKTAAQFDATMSIVKDGMTVDAQSIMGLMMLAAGPGCCITVSAIGPDAALAVEAVVELVGRRFDEDR